MNSIQEFGDDFRYALLPEDAPYTAVIVRNSSAEIYADDFDYVPENRVVVLFLRGLIVATVGLADVDKVARVNG